MIRDFKNTDWKLIARIYADQEIKKQLDRSHENEITARWRSLKGWETRINNKKIKP